MGSIVNQVMTAGVKADPEVGMPATVCMYSDRNPCQIAEVVHFKSGAKAGQVRGVRTRPLAWKVVKGSEHDGSAEYEYTEMPDAPMSGLYLRNERGQYQKAGKGARLSIGRAERYYDPHF